MGTKRCSGSGQESLNPAVHRFVEEAGNFTLSVGLGRIVGQVYSYLYFSPSPRTLGDMQSVLGVSKGSASMAVRQLEQWGAVRKIWVKGDRKDYYEANDWIGQILRNVIADTIGKRLVQSNGVLMDEESNGLIDADPDAEFIRSRLEHLQSFRARAKKVWENPLVRKLVG